MAIILGGVFVSMGVYAFLGSEKDRDAVQKGSRFVLGLGDFLLHWFLWVLRPLERLLLALGATADTLNFLGLFLGLLSGAAVAAGNLEIGGWAMVASGVCDVLDGRIARARGATSLYGKFIDSTLDRFAEVSVLLGFAFFLRNRPTGAFLSAAALGGSVLVSYSQSRGETVGIQGRGGLMQRAERLVILCLACLWDPWTVAWGYARGDLAIAALGLIAAASLGTAIYRTVWISRRL